jgi:uncharacterized membrane protein YgcG
MAMRMAFGFSALTVVLFGLPAQAVAPVVRDEANLLKKETVDKINELVRSLYLEFGKDVLVETYSTVSDNQAEKVKEMTREDRAKFFDSWAKKRCDALVIRGVYVLICKDPSFVQVEVTESARKLFPDKDREKLVQQLIADMSRRKFDEAVVKGVKFVAERFEVNR